ncbi:hypothetical protein ACJX0J_030485, partial [Zea mays]
HNLLNLTVWQIENVSKSNASKVDYQAKEAQDYKIGSLKANGLYKANNKHD